MADRRLIKLGPMEKRARKFKTGEEALLAGTALKSLGANSDTNMNWECQAAVEGYLYMLGSQDAIVQVEMRDGKLFVAWQGSGPNSGYGFIDAYTSFRGFVDEFAPEQQPIVLMVDNTPVEVQFGKGSIKVGCTNIGNATVRQITERLFD